MKHIFRIVLAVLLLSVIKFSTAQIVCTPSFTYRVSNDTVYYNNTSTDAGTGTYSYWKWEFGNSTTATDSCCPFCVFPNSDTVRDPPG